MEIDLQSLFGLHVYCVQLYSLAETPEPPLLPFGLINEDAIGQPRMTTSLCDPLNASFAIALLGFLFLSQFFLVFCSLCTVTNTQFRIAKAILVY
jgi:hypothetical protein